MHVYPTTNTWSNIDNQLLKLNMYDYWAHVDIKVMMKEYWRTEKQYVAASALLIIGHLLISYIMYEGQSWGSI